MPEFTSEEQLHHLSIITAQKFSCTFILILRNIPGITLSNIVKVGTILFIETFQNKFEIVEDIVKYHLLPQLHLSSFPIFLNYVNTRGNSSLSTLCISWIIPYSMEPLCLCRCTAFNTYSNVFFFFRFQHFYLYILAFPGKVSHWSITLFGE